MYVRYALSRFKLNKKYGIEEPRKELFEAADQFVAKLHRKILRHHVANNLVAQLKPAL